MSRPAYSCAERQGEGGQRCANKVGELQAHLLAVCLAQLGARDLNQPSELLHLEVVVSLQVDVGTQTTRVTLRICATACTGPCLQGKLHQKQAHKSDRWATCVQLQAGIQQQHGTRHAAQLR